MSKKRDVTESQVLRTENGILRWLLWIHHWTIGKHLLYGDDGEMRCSKCGIDFKRDSAESISARAVTEEQMEAYIANLRLRIAGIHVRLDHFRKALRKHMNV